MSELKLVTSFSLLLVLLLGSHVLFPFGQAYAGHKPCCTYCGQKYCASPGTGNCPWFPCLTDDSATLQAKFATRAGSNSHPSPLLRLTSINRLITLPNSGQCAKNNFILRLFPNEGDRLTFASDFPKYNASHDILVAFQMGTN